VEKKRDVTVNIKDVSYCSVIVVLLTFMECRFCLIYTSALRKHLGHFQLRMTWMVDTQGSVSPKDSETNHKSPNSAKSVQASYKP
jgi:hypothetical protein